MTIEVTTQQTDSGYCNEILEQNILANMMYSDDIYIKSLDEVRVHYFSNPKNRLIAKAILDCFCTWGTISFPLVYEQLRKNGNLKDIGGAYGLSVMYSNYAYGSLTEQKANWHVLRDLWKKRQGAVLSAELYKQILSDETDANELLNRAQEELNKVLIEGSVSEKTPYENYREAIEEVRKTQMGEITPGVLSGFVEIDRLTNGFTPGTLSVIAARPAMGKSALAATMARNMAYMFSTGVLFFSLEMTTTDLYVRLISAESGRENSSLRKAGRYGKAELDSISEKSQLLADIPLYIVSGSAKLSDIEAKSRQYKTQHEIGCVIVDYLQKIDTSEEGKFTNREQQVSQVSGKLKALSMALDIPVIALAQLSRAVELRDDKQPQLSDLRESGAIEQDADMVMFLYRPEYYGIKEDSQGKSTEGLAYLDLAKHRGGSTGTAILGFRAENVTFYNLDGTPMNKSEKVVGVGLKQESYIDKIPVDTYTDEDGITHFDLKSFSANKSFDVAGDQNQDTNRQLLHTQDTSIQTPEHTDDWEEQKFTEANTFGDDIDSAF